MDENGRDNKGPGVQGNYYENYVAYYLNILVREYRCSGGTETANPVIGGSSANIRFLY